MPSFRSLPAALAGLGMAMAMMPSSSSSVMAQSTKYDVNPWAVPSGSSYPPVDAKVGDTITFWWDPNTDTTGQRTVYINPSGNCWDKSDAKWVGSTSGASYTFTADDAGKTHLFASDIDTHCEDGLNIAVTISADDNDVPSWAPPTWSPTNKPTEWVPPPTWAPTNKPTEYVPPPTWAPTNKPTEYVPPPTWAPTNKPTFAAPIPSPVAPPTTPPVDITSPPVAVDDQSQVIRIDQWIIQQYEPINVNVGDTLEVQVGLAHDLYLHPSLSCDETDRELIGEPGSLATYTFKAEDAGKQLLFACDVGNHCEQGMQLLITVAGEPIDAGDDGNNNNDPANQSQVIRVDQWVIQEYEPIDVNVGDILEVQVGQAHNLFLHPTLSCDETGRELIGEPGSLATYTFKEEDAGKQLLFACDVGNHCEQGMQLLINVAGEADEEQDDNNADVGVLEEPEVIRVDQWVIQEYEPINVNVGDILEVQVGLAHDLYLHPTLSCDETGRELIGEPGSLATYIFSPADAGKQLLFACDVGNHCEQGMQLLVNVAGAGVVGGDDLLGGVNDSATFNPIGGGNDSGNDQGDSDVLDPSSAFTLMSSVTTLTAAFMAMALML